MTWKVLEPLVQADPSAIRSAVRAVTEAWGRNARRQAVAELAATLADKRMAFVLRLLDETTAPPRRLALELIPGIGNVDANLRRNSREALRDRRLPLPTRLRATKALLRGLDPAGKGTALMIRAYVAGLGRKRILERIDEVATEFGNPQAMDIVRAELRTLEKLKCPRCGSLRRRKNMAEHLWNRHQMLLVGHRARTAIQALDERLVTEPPATALIEFHRDLLNKGLHDEEAIAQLRKEAGERHESVCPHCHAFIPVLEPPPPRPAEIAPGRISANGCAVALNEVAGQPHLSIYSDSTKIYDGVDPAQTNLAGSWRRNGIMCSMFAVVVALILPSPLHLMAALILIAVALLCLALAGLRSHRPFDPLSRAVDLAWTKLIPTLRPGEAIARFALASIDRGNPTTRAAALNKAIEEAEEAAALGAIPGEALAPLWWLKFVDVDNDATAMIVDKVQRCLHSELPLSAAAGLLQYWRDSRPTRAERARVRAVLCEQAFEAGLGVWDIVELGRAYPAFGASLSTDDVDGLARLCFLWEQRLIRPWQKCGSAATVFELARNQELSAQIFEYASDLLLYCRIPGPAGGPSEELLLCGRGMVFRDAVLREPPTEVKIRACEEWRGGGYEARFGQHRLRFNEPPGAVIDKLKNWSDFFLRDFLPQCEGVLKYRAGERLQSVLGPAIMRCPACSKNVIPLPGQVAVTANQVRSS